MKYSLRTPQYLLMYESLLVNLGNEEKGNFKLFNIVDDPGEHLDISDLEKETLAIMKGDLRRWLQPMIPEQVGKFRKTKIDEEMKERLEALGYLQ